MYQTGVSVAGSSRPKYGSRVGNGEDQLEFPFVCENCLGPNPYVRMIQAPNGAACKLTNRPFTVFKWRVRGAAGAGWKVTQICIEVAKMKNCCQVCMRDMTYLVPLAVRDSVLKNNPHQVALPQTAAGRHYFFEQKKRNDQLRAEQEKLAQLAPPPPPRGAQLLSTDVAAMVPPPPPPMPSGECVEELDDGSGSEEEEHTSSNEDKEDKKTDAPVEAKKEDASPELKRKRDPSLEASELNNNKKTKTS